MENPLIRRPGDGVPIPNPVGGAITLVVRGDETGGRLTVLETVAAPDEGPPLHTHANEDEYLFVLEGTFRFRLGDDVHDAPAGSLVFVPRQLSHTWQNVGREAARMLVWFAPAGMEHFFERFADLDGPGPEAFVRAAEGTGMEVVGPPLAVTHPQGA